MRDIAVGIRPTLEYFSRVAYPAHYPPVTCLAISGTVAKRAEIQSNPIMYAVDVQEIRDLTDYGNRFHHDTNAQGYLTIVVTDAELQGLVQRTLGFCRRR